MHTPCIAHSQIACGRSQDGSPHRDHRYHTLSHIRVCTVRRALAEAPTPQPAPPHASAHAPLVHAPALLLLLTLTHRRVSPPTGTRLLADLPDQAGRARHRDEPRVLRPPEARGGLDALAARVDKEVPSICSSRGRWCIGPAEPRKVAERPFRGPGDNYPTEHNPRSRPQGAAGGGGRRGPHTEVTVHV